MAVAVAVIVLVEQPPRGSKRQKMSQTGQDVGSILMKYRRLPPPLPGWRGGPFLLYLCVSVPYFAKVEHD